MNPLLGGIRSFLARWQPPESWPDWAKRGVGLGPILGGAVAALLLWFPTHSIFESVFSGGLLFAVMAGLRAFDANLEPVWRQLARVPRGVRMGAGVLAPIWFSISQFGPSAAGAEVSTARTTLVITSLVGYTLLHPDPEPDAA